MSLTLREEISGLLCELEAMVKVVGEVAVVPLDARNCPEKVENIVKLVNSKEQHIKDVMDKAECHAERQKVIEKLKDELNVRNSYVEKIQTCLKTSETTLISAIFQANQKLKSISEADNRKVSADDLIKYAHKISKTNAVAAPLTWKQGDPERPFPIDAQMRQGWLANLGKPRQEQPAGFQNVPNSNLNSALQANNANNFQVPRMQQAQQMQQMQQQQGGRMMGHQNMFPPHMQSPGMQGMFPAPPGMRMPTPPNMNAQLPAPPPYGSVPHRQQWGQNANQSPKPFGNMPHMPMPMGGGRPMSPRSIRPPVPSYGSPGVPGQSRPLTPSSMQVGPMSVPGSPRMFSQGASRPRAPSLPMGAVPPGMKLSTGGPPAKKINVAAPTAAPPVAQEVEQMSSDSSSNSSSSDSPS